MVNYFLFHYIWLAGCGSSVEKQTINCNQKREFFRGGLTVTSLKPTYSEVTCEASYNNEQFYVVKRKGINK